MEGWLHDIEQYLNDNGPTMGGKKHVVGVCVGGGEGVVVVVIGGESGVEGVGGW